MHSFDGVIYAVLGRIRAYEIVWWTYMQEQVDEWSKTTQFDKSSLDIYDHLLCS